MAAMLIALMLAATPVSLSFDLASAATQSAAASRPSVRRKHRSRRAPGPPSRRLWSLDARVELVSDYRPGGISETDGKPALQAEFNVTHRSGVFATAFASSLAANGGDRVELDLTAGYSKSVGKTTLSALTTAYLFPGVRHSSYLELGVGAERRFGAASIGVSAAWSPPQANIGHRPNLYLGIDGSVPVKGTLIVLDGSLGRENGAFGNHKLDWSAGGRVQFKQLELSLAYVDARRTGHAPHSGATLIGGIALTF